MPCNSDDCPDPGAATNTSIDDKPEDSVRFTERIPTQATSFQLLLADNRAFAVAGQQTVKSILQFRIPSPERIKDEIYPDA